MRGAALLSLASGLGAPLWKPLNTEIPEAPGFGLRDWLDHVRGLMRVPSAEVALVWPPQRNRGRVYVHLLSPEGSPLAFGKVAFDGPNAERLTVEAEALRQLASTSLTRCHPPRLLAEGVVNGQRFLLVEPVPETAQPVPSRESSFPTEAVHEFAGEPRNLPAGGVARESWWRRFEAVAAETPAFSEEACRLLDHPARVCAVHGDMGPGNLARGDGRLWIFDWEEFHARGPIMTDEISFWLALEVAAGRDDAAGLEAFAGRFLRGSSDRRADAVLALAFLHGAGRTMATRLLRRWSKTT